MPAAVPPLLPLSTWWWCLVLLQLSQASPAGQAFPYLSLDGSPLNHLLLDPRSGHLYVGAVNHLYHLSPDLQVLSSSQTGPKLDSPECLPPIVPKDCPSARVTPNTNKILLLEEGVDAVGSEVRARSLIVCGTLFQGICDKRSLGNVSEVLYQTSNPVDTQYVAANDPRVSTVGVILNQKGVGLMLVGRGYTSKGPSDIPPITTRRLSPSSSPSRQAFSQDEELGKLVVGSYSEYNNNFISAFNHSDHVYFLFSRRDMWHKKEYRTYVSRLCAWDRSFYSYVEVPLECSGGYNLAQGASPAEHQGRPALFVAMAAGQASTPTATGRSALCVYGMSELDASLQRAQELCYTEGGRGRTGQEEAYIEYEVSSKCLRLPKDSLKEYPCGGEHTPSPIASAVPLSATPSLTRETQLTAVTTATEAGHTIALLGDKKGWLHKVFIEPDTTGTLYQSVLVDQDRPVNADLLLDQSGQNVYVLTDGKVSKVSVSQCEQQPDCQSCLSVRDPYCGWCVLEGRCTRRLECSREGQANHWLWSYQPANQPCVTVQSLKPAIQSREEATQVSLTVAQLPTLTEEESLSCSFGTLPPQPAIVKGTTITCQSPLPELLPPSPPGSDHVSLRVSVMFRDVAISSSDIIFYDCRAVGRLNTTSPCMACVGSVWPCSWCVLGGLCTHTNNSCPRQHTIHNSLEQLEPRGPESCPCVWALQSSPLVPMGFLSPLTLLGRNLDMFQREEQYVCVVVVEEEELKLNATLEKDPENMTYTFTCSAHKFQYPVNQLEYSAPIYLQRGSHQIDSAPNLRLQLYDCSVGQSDCSQCRAVPSDYGCVWCGGESPGCAYHLSCTSSPGPEDACPPPHIIQIQPVSGPVEGGVLVTIHGSNLGMHYQDIQGGVTVAGVSCLPQPHGYLISTRIVCELQPSKQETEGPVIVTVGDSEPGQSLQTFTYQDPQLTGIVPDKGPVSGGTSLTVQGTRLLTGQRKDLTAYVGQQPCYIVEEVNGTHLVCRTSPSNQTAELTVRVLFGKAERTVPGQVFHYMEDPVITAASPAESFYEGGRNVKVSGRNLDVVATANDLRAVGAHGREHPGHEKEEIRQTVGQEPPTSLQQHRVKGEMTCVTPSVTHDSKVLGVWFELDNVKVSFESVAGKTFSYYPNPELLALNRDDPDTPYRFKPGGVIAVEGKDLTRAMTRDEVVARLGDQECEVKTLDSTHLYCEVLCVSVCRRKSKQALRDYKKVLVQLETLEINVGDQCRKEFTDLMTEMMDLSSDVGGPGIPLLDYKTYAERVFFPGQRGAPLSQNLDLPESRRRTVEQGLGQLNNLLNNRLFLIRFIHTLEAQQNFSQRDRGYVASLLTMALHDKLEYFTDVMKTLLGDLVQQYVTKNPKLMLRRTETVVEKMLTNWMSICLYSFLKEVAGEPLYMLYRAIKYQVDKGPVDAVTGKAKRTLNDSHLLREDIDYCSITLTVMVKSGVEVQPCPVKVLDTDTITQVKDKILDQIYKGAPFSQRPAADSLDLEWRSGQAGHLTLSDDDVTAIVQGRWKKLNTLQHYKVPDGATVALIPRSAAVVGIHQVYQTGEKTPMLDGEGEEGLRLWHLVKSNEEPEMPKHRKSSMRERERAKAIPEIYLTRLLSMKGTLQKFVDDVFVAILNTKRPPPIAVRFFFDFLDDMAEKHGIDDPETVHIWKTNSLPLRFWVNILKNPQFVFDVQVTDSVDAVLSVIAQTFIDSCTTSEHKVGRDSPVNKLLYAREIPRYKQLVERYYSDIHSAASGCYQEMNSTLTELSGSFGSDMNSLVALLELYKYINKYYDQIIASLEEDAAGQKMQLAYRLQQVAALVENKVTDL
uniref:Plexin-B1 n=1 Tax=Oncorhynchus kisutch TaxID=8019 RepID=A0A8C7DW48_ONCKI